MKRIKSACLDQTIHFHLKEDLAGHDGAAEAVKDELEQFKLQLERKNTLFNVY